MRKRIKEALQESVLDLYEGGMISEARVRKYPIFKNWRPKMKRFDAEGVKKLRRRHKISQSEFANYLCIGKSTIQQWEQGVKKPSGPSLKLLNLLDKRGLEVLL
jgi:putative transcriptional regulator